MVIAQGQTSTQPTTIAKYCPDISPCIYVEHNDCKYDVNIECNAPMEEVKAVFSSFTASLQIFRITLYVQSPGDTIPADILGRSLTTFYLTIIGNINFPSISIDPEAFRSSRLTIESVEFQKLDMSQVDFQFLAGGIRVHSLSLLRLSNIQRSLPTIPALPGLALIQIYLSTGLNQEWQNNNGSTSLLPNGLTNFYAAECGLDDGGMGQLLDWLMPNSAATLRILLFNGNKISSIPRQISSFQQLYSVKIFRNIVDLTVPSNSFNGTINQEIGLGLSRVVRVEPNAFIGI